MAGELHGLSWNTNSRCIALTRSDGASGPKHFHITHNEFRQISEDWYAAFPQESQLAVLIEQTRIANLKNTAQLDQNLAKFRDSAKAYLSDILKDPELLTLICKLIYRLESH